LADIKLCTQELEAKYAGAVETGKEEGSISIRLFKAKIVLASTKMPRTGVPESRDLREAALQFQRGSFAPFPYTYPDYRWPETLCFFGALRSRYLEQLRAARPDAS
jgi:hypothetical protein